MNIYSYLVTIANLQHLSRVGTPLKDTFIHLGSLYELTKDLVSLPDFPLEGYRNNGFQKQGNLAVYASKDLRDFIFEGRGSSDDEGVIIKLQYASADDETDVKPKFNTLVYFIGEKELKGDEQEELIKYLKDLGTRVTRANRNKRSFLDKLIVTTGLP